MTKWNKEKLEEMTQTQNEFTKIKINYTLLSEKYFEIIEKTYQNGDVMPLAFKDVELAYTGRITDDIRLPEIAEDIQKQIDEKKQKRKVMHIKHFSRSISHEQWFEFLDEEIRDFIKKYPEYEHIML